MPTDDIHELELGSLLTVDQVRQWRQHVEAALAEHSENLKSLIHGIEERLWQMESGSRFSPSVEEALQSDTSRSSGGATLAMLTRRMSQLSNLPPSAVRDSAPSGS